MFSTLCTRSHRATAMQSNSIAQNQRKMITGFVQKHENEIPGLFQDNSRTFSVFKDSI